MTFDDLKLPTPVRNALADAGLTTPTLIQERALPVIMSGKDVVGIAQTGTGKTIAYLLPLLRQWKFRKDAYSQFLIVVPTRELVIQAVEEIERLSTYMNVVVVGVHGGTNLKKDAAAVEMGCDFVVGTPGRLYDLVTTGSLKFRALRTFVIDEVDEMLELGFRPQLLRLIELLPQRRQNLLFSATMTEDVSQIIDETFDYPVTVEAAPTGTPLDQIEQFGYQVPNFYTKVNLLREILRDEATYTRALVFAPGKRLADVTAELLEADFPEQIAVIHGNKSQNYRFRSLGDFQSGTRRILIATDLVSRGIDLTGVSHVINIDTPDEAENYMHRIGRTGRADASGTSITFTTEAEQPHLEAIESLMDRRLQQLSLPEDLDISTELIKEEMPVSNQPIIQIKDDVIPGAFHEKKEKNRREKLTRTELQALRRKRGMRSKKKKKRRK